MMKGIVRSLALTLAALPVAAPAWAEPEPEPEPGWRLEQSDSQYSFDFLRTEGPMDAMGDRPVERMWLGPTWEDDKDGERWRGRRFQVRRQSLVFNCDWLTETGLKRQQKMWLDGRDRGPELTAGDYGPSFIDDGGERGQRELALACGLGTPPEPRFSTARGAIAFALSQQPKEAPELWTGGVPPPPYPPGYTPPQAKWLGSFFVVRADGGRTLLLDRTSLNWRGNVAAVRMLTVLSNDLGLGASLSQVEFDCVNKTETVTGAQRWGRLTDDIWISAFGFTRPIAGLPATQAALAAACSGSGWFDGRTPVGANVAEAVAAARGAPPE